MNFASLRGDVVDVTWGDLPGSVGTTKLYGELMIQILVRLPVISILRFKSVCKAWYHLFNSHIFIQNHTHIAVSSYEMSDSLSLLVHVKQFQQSLWTWTNKIFSLFLQHAFEKPIMKSMEFPLEGVGGYIRVLGSINGLVCLRVCTEATFTVLWNPATRKQCRIPYPQLIVRGGECASLGFAYDKKTDCYKIVRILSCESSISQVPQVARVEIYSTGTNTWRTTDTVHFPRLYNPSEDGDVFSGVPYWYAIYVNSKIGLDRFQDLVVRFDASAEAFTFHPLQHVDSGDLSRLSMPDIGYFWNQSLAAMGEDPVVMFRKYGLKSGCVEWIDIRKLKRFDAGKDLFGIEKSIVKAPPDSLSIDGFGRNGEIISAHYDNTLRLCGKEETKDLAVFDQRHCSKVLHYNESLVWPSTLY